MTTPVASILWKRLDREGHETSRLEQRDGLWHLSGAAVFAHEGEPCRLEYLIVCDASWKTTSAKVSGWLGQAPVEVGLRVDAERRWRANGVEQPQVAGCLDVDLNFSPSTNLLPIRRLGLPIGGEATVRAAWLRFPSFALEPLDQSYRRLGESTYRYESRGGRFVAELEVDSREFVTFYPGFAAAVR